MQMWAMRIPGWGVVDQAWVQCMSFKPQICAMLDSEAFCRVGQLVDVLPQIHA